MQKLKYFANQSYVSLIYITDVDAFFLIFFSFHCGSYQCMLIPIEDDEKTVFTLQFLSKVFYGMYFIVCKIAVCGWSSEYITRLFNCRSFA